MRKLILDRGSEAIGTIIWNLEALARRVTLVSVWRSSGSHLLSGGLWSLPDSCGAWCSAWRRVVGSADVHHEAAVASGGT